MKQKRTFVTLLLIIALLCLGIAYAAISGVNLTVTGNVSATAADGYVKVQFTEAKTTVEPAVGNAEANLGTADETTGLVTTATFNVSGLTTEGQTATFTYTIENGSSDMAATLANPTISWDAKGAEWFDVDMELSTNDLTESDGDANSATLTLTVTLLKTPVSTNDETASTDTATITIVAEPVENN